jgi:hypothetical protein
MKWRGQLAPAPPDHRRTFSNAAAPKRHAARSILTMTKNRSDSRIGVRSRRRRCAVTIRASATGPDHGAAPPRGGQGRVAPAAMSEQEKKLDGPDFVRGVPLEDLAEGSMILGQAAGEAVVLLARSAPITTAPSPRGCWWRIPSVAPGTMPASACAPERHCAPRHWTRSRAGVSTNGTEKSMSATSLNRRNAGPGRQQVPGRI